jgi:hypothetical protein
MRYSWVDEEMRPMKPKFSPKADDEEAEVSYDKPEGETIKMSCWAGSELEGGIEDAALVIEAEAEDLDLKLMKELSAKAAEARRSEQLDMLVTGSITGGGLPKKPKDKKKADRLRRKNTRRMMRAALKKWRAEQHDLLDKYSRQQLLTTIIPQAGLAVRMKKAEGKTKKEAKVIRENRIRFGL